jgi:DNA modification methylase
MRNSTLPRDNVLDLFGGSGSTLVAAEIDGRNAFLMEKDEGFCDAIVQRYFETFDEVLVLRNGEEINPHTFISAE